MHDDPISAQRIREALAAPIEEREKLDLPKPTPVDQIARSGLKPAPPRSGKKGVVPR